MVFTMSIYVLESAEQAFCDDGITKNSIEKFFMILMSPIWPVYTVIKTSWKQFHCQAISSNPQKDKEEIEKLAKISNRAHLIEVCFESSLQPLIQLHAILGLLLQKKLLENDDFSWAQTMEAFWKKDLVKIFDLRETFNPQVLLSMFVRCIRWGKHVPSSSINNIQMAQFLFCIELIIYATFCLSPIIC